MRNEDRRNLTIDRIRAAMVGEVVWDGRCPSFGARKLANGRAAFFMKTRVNGVQRKVNIGHHPDMSVAEGLKIARELRTRSDKGEDIRSARRVHNEALSLEMIFAHYSGVYALAERLDPQTVKDAATVLKLYMPADVYRMPAKNISYAIMLKVVGDALAIGAQREAQRVEKAAKAGRARRPVASPGVAQANRLIAVTSCLFGLGALLEGGPSHNPLKKVRKHPLDDRLRSLSSAEIGRLHLACADYERRGEEFMDGAADIIRLLLYTGARLQEVVGAT